MGHVAFVDPGIRRYHLHERLGRELRARGHRTTVLCTDPVEATFWAAQEQGAVAIRSGSIRTGAPAAARAPIRELTELDLHARGERGGRASRRAAARLAGLEPALARWFDEECPDLVLLHGRRDGVPRLVQYVARERGADVLWTGDGMLPHTLQLDTSGLDGESSAARSTAGDFRDVQGDERFCAAALAGTIGRSLPLPLARRQVNVPPFGRRLGDAARALCAGGGLRGVRGAIAALCAWRLATQPKEPERRRYEIPAQPFVAVLLQRDDDPRLLLDGRGAPDAAALARAAATAAAATGLDLAVTAVLPEGGLRRRTMRALCSQEGIAVEVPAAAVEAAAAAAAVVTVNHPLAVAGLLAGTPVLHFGRAAYGVPGIALRADEASLAPSLRAVLAAPDQPALRARFLTWLLRQGHVWCSPEHPDHNGITGLVERVEAFFGERSPSAGGARHYAPGPAWPLRVEGTA